MTTKNKQKNLKKNNLDKYLGLPEINFEVGIFKKPDNTSL